MQLNINKKFKIQSSKSKTILKFKSQTSKCKILSPLRYAPYGSAARIGKRNAMLTRSLGRIMIHLAQPNNEEILHF
jgi:hypothetical protein